MIRLENLITKKSITLGGIKDEYILASKDFGEAEAAHNTTDYINLIGSHVNSTSFKERSIIFVGSIKINSKEIMKEKKRLLNKIINPKHNIKAYYGNYCIIFKPDSSIAYSKDIYENKSSYCKFIIAGTAFKPVFELIKPNIYRESKITPVPLFPLIIPKKKGIAFGYIPATSINNVPNDGDLDAGFIVRFTATEGTVKNPKIINNKTDKHIEILLEMNQGDIVEVSTISGEKHAKLIRGVSETDIFKYVSKKSTMSMMLSVGINDLTIGASGNAINLTSSIVFTPQWLEVQE